jgi:hypothetical protein
MVHEFAPKGGVPQGMATLMGNDDELISDLGSPIGGQTHIKLFSNRIIF